MNFELSPMIMNQLTSGTLDYLGLALYVLVLFLAGYILGLLVANALKRVFSIPELENSLVRYGAMTTKLWGSIRHFLAQYLKWFITVLVLTTIEAPFVMDIANFMGNLLWFILLTIAGLMLGGILFKVVKEGLDSIGVEKWLERHNVEGAFGGLRFSSIIAGILKWYVVLLFANEGTVKLNLPIISKFISDLVQYIPGALSGVAIIMVSLLVARFTSQRIRNREISFREPFALTVESVITYFGIVLALPILIKGVDVTILADSFKILMAGVALAIGIGGGFGLKEKVAQIEA